MAEALEALDQSEEALDLAEMARAIVSLPTLSSVLISSEDEGAVLGYLCHRVAYVLYARDRGLGLLADAS